MCVTYNEHTHTTAASNESPLLSNNEVAELLCAAEEEAILNMDDDAIVRGRPANVVTS